MLRAGCFLFVKARGTTCVGISIWTSHSISTEQTVVQSQLLDALPRGNGGQPARITNHCYVAFVPHRGPVDSLYRTRGGHSTRHALSDSQHLRLAVRHTRVYSSLAATAYFSMYQVYTILVVLSSSFLTNCPPNRNYDRISSSIGQYLFPLIERQSNVARK